MTDGLAYSAAIGLALVFSYSAIKKLSNSRQMRRALVAVGLPEALAKPISVIELLTALLLVVAPAVGAVVALALLALFSAFIAYLLVRRLDVSCGCFGANESKSVSEVDIVRNLLLIAFAIMSLTIARPHSLSLEEVIAATTTAVIGLVLLSALSTRRELGQLFSNQLPGGT